MPSDEEGNKGIKRKSDNEESAEESANKHLCSGDGGSTSTGITHVDQAEEYVRKNWIVCSVTCEIVPYPLCSVCPKCFPIYVEPSPFKDHCKKKHPDIDTEGNESEWIFGYFDLVEDTQHLRCKICQDTVEVLEFKGQFVDHFIEHEPEFHKIMVENLFEAEGGEEFKKIKTINLLRHLYKEFKKTIEDNENKKKYKKSEEGTSSEKQDEQEEGNVGKINWMKCCDVEDWEATPRCDICNEHHLFYIDPSTFKDHCKEKHPDIDTEVHESEWMIFHYFDTVKNTHHLKCKRCNERLEVLEFKGQFVNHFDKEHERKAEQKVQRGNEDQEVAERLRLTKKFISYLHSVAITREAIEVRCDVRNIAWWMKHVIRVERNTVVCGVPNCQDVYPFPVVLCKSHIKTHLQYHYKEVKLGKNMNNWKYFSFDDYLLRCKRCNKVFSYYLNTGFRAHLEKEHNIIQLNDMQPRQTIDNDDDTNQRINELMLYLIDIMQHKWKT